MPSLIGNKPNQVPSNGDLGTLAFQDSNAINISGGTAVVDTLTADAIRLRVDTEISNISPSLNLDFANSKALDPRITFTRASTATFYDGKTVAKAEENLILQSETIGASGWFTSDATVTANTTVAPNGTTTAETVASANTSSYVGFPVTGANSTVYTFSFFIKNNNSTQSRVMVRSSSTVADNFINWTGATLTSITNSSGATASFVSVGSGWYRVSVTYTSVETTQIGRAYPDMAVGTNSVYLWGFQLEQRSAVSAYTPTTTAAITNYIPALQTAASGVPRFEHNPLTGESLGLEIEEQRTNLFLRSEEFDNNSAWSKTSCTITADAAVAPNGTLTADKVVFNSGTTANNAAILYNLALTSGTYQISIYAKAGEFSSIQFRENAEAGTLLVVNLLNGAITNGDAAQFINPSATPVGNGWYRITFTSKNNMTNANRYGIRNSDTGNGFGGVYLWGAQLEAGAFATSYIPTVASQVTRAADSAVITGTNFSSWYRANEGTLYTESQVILGAVEDRAFFITDATASSNTIALEVHTSSTFSGRVNANAVGQVGFGSSSLSGTVYKQAMAYRLNDFAYSKGGDTVATDTTGVLPIVDRACIGANGAPTSFGNAIIKKISYFPKRLTNEELQEMTS